MTPERIDELEVRVRAWYRLQRMKRERKVKESVAAYMEGTDNEESPRP